jgi:hypothetical protein
MEVNDRAKQVLADAPHIYTCVLTKRGPHVTPELFSTTAGRLWCMTASSTLKARLFRKDPRVGIAAISGSAAAVMLGRAATVDPAHPTDVLRMPGTVAFSPKGVTSFVADNAAELTGAVLDAVAGRLGRPLPPHRIVVAIEPLATAVLDDSGIVSDHPWDEPAAALRTDESADDDEIGLPDHPLVRSGPTVLGWQTAAGHPLALPATWNSRSSTATVDAALFSRTGAAAEGPGCVTFDTWTGYGPTGKQGVMLRGEGAAARAGGATGVTVALHVERAITWDGVHTQTESVDAATGT